MDIFPNFPFGERASLIRDRSRDRGLGGFGRDLRGPGAGSESRSLLATCLYIYKHMFYILNLSTFPLLGYSFRAIALIDNSPRFTDPLNNSYS